MTVRREEEVYYRQAEKLIKERYNFYTSNYPHQQAEMYLVMTILDIAVKMKQQESTMDTEPFTSRLEPLLQELESALEKK